MIIILLLIILLSVISYKAMRLLYLGIFLLLVFSSNVEAFYWNKNTVKEDVKFIIGKLIGN